MQLATVSLRSDDRAPFAHRICPEPRRQENRGVGVCGLSFGPKAIFRYETFLQCTRQPHRSLRALCRLWHLAHGARLPCDLEASAFGFLDAPTLDVGSPVGMLPERMKATRFSASRTTNPACRPASWSIGGGRQLRVSTEDAKLRPRQCCVCGVEW